ncbi:hypothetical protein BGZ54_007754 [Gamsiella multidivaricata]|nr:hypothetical protein BGZ54_007754 [Gamsiella multidivaricata]
MDSIDSLVNSLSSLNLSNASDRQRAYNQIQSAFQDLSRSVSTDKASKPPLFHGGRDALVTRNWLEELERYCRRTNLAQKEWTFVAVDHLRGTALTWYHTSTLTDDTSWEVFKTAFVAESKSPGRERSILMELRELRQTSIKDITSYITRFCDLVLQLSNPTDDRLREYFISGLVTQVQLQVEIANLSTWQQAVKVAERINGVYVRAETKTKPTYVASQAPTAEPMNVEAMRVLLANLANLANFVPNAINVASLHRRFLPKLDQAEKARCFREGRCYRCRRFGHIAENCRGEQTFNNFETPTTTTDSGKRRGRALNQAGLGFTKPSCNSSRVKGSRAVVK